MSLDLPLSATNQIGTVVALFKNQPDAERAIDRLKRGGFSESEIGVAMRDRSQQRELIEGTGTQAAEGAATATGAISGGVLGSVIGLLAGVGALAIPGVGPIVAGGALASTLAGAGIGAAAGGLLGALMGMGIPEEDAHYFDEGFRAGGILVTVNAQGRIEQARKCLNEAGGDLGSMGQVFQSDAPSTSSTSFDRTGPLKALLLAGMTSMALGGCASNNAADEPGARIRDTTLTAQDTINPNDTLPRIRDSVPDSTQH
jgi:hypothetical protein